MAHVEVGRPLGHHIYEWRREECDRHPAGRSFDGLSISR